MASTNSVFVFIAVILLQPLASATETQCDSTKCIGGGFKSEESQITLGQCWGSKDDSVNFPFACEAGYDAHVFPHLPLKFENNIQSFSYYTCCPALEKTKKRELNCVATACTSPKIECWVAKSYMTWTMTCDSSFPFPHLTGVSRILNNYDLEHYVCCNKEFSGDFQEAPFQQSSSIFKRSAIVSGVSGLISVIASSISLWMIHRSLHGFSRVSHRLIAGLSISDLFFSLTFANFRISSSPAGVTDSFWTTTANHEVCYAFGVIFCIFSMSGLFYNSSLNIYYLLVIMWGKREEWIRKKAEPFMHLVPISAGVFFSILAIATDNISDLDCRWDGIMIAYTGLGLLLISFSIVLGSLAMMYFKIRTQEKKMEKYGQSSLRRSVRGLQPAVRGLENENVRNNKKKILHSRTVMTKALLYTTAFSVTYIITIMSAFLKSEVLGILYHIFMPLQGFWNLLILMYPRVKAAKNKKDGDNYITWRQAVVIVFSSPKKQRFRHNNDESVRPSWPLGLWKKVNSYMTNAKRKTLHGNEEEKIEICDSEDSSSLPLPSLFTEDVTPENFKEEEKTEICNAEVGSFSMAYAKNNDESIELPGDGDLSLPNSISETNEEIHQNKKSCLSQIIECSDNAY